MGNFFGQEGQDTKIGEEVKQMEAPEVEKTDKNAFQITQYLSLKKTSSRKSDSFHVYSDTSDEGTRKKLMEVQSEMTNVLHNIILDKKKMLESDKYETFLDEFIHILDNITNLKYPLQFKRTMEDAEQQAELEKAGTKMEINPNTRKLVLVAFGEMGAGKSTLLNNLMGRYVKRFKLDDQVQDRFMASAGMSAVTTQISSKIVNGSMQLIDSPGSNDPDKKRTDQTINSMICYSTEMIFKEKRQGISGFVQCVSRQKNMRIYKSDVEPMVKILRSLTLNQFWSREVDYSKQEFPRINVVFTDLSKHDKKVIRTNGFKQMCTLYKQLVANEFIQQMNLAREEDKVEVRQNVEYLLPEDNFYAYVYDEDDCDEDAREQEMEELDRLIIDNMRHGRWCIDESGDKKTRGFYQPVQMPWETAVTIRQNLGQVTGYLQETLSFVDQMIFMHQNQKINKMVKDIEKVQAELISITQECPWVLQKTPALALEFIDTAMKNLNKIVMATIMQEMKDDMVNKDDLKNHLLEQNKDYEHQMAKKQEVQDRQRKIIAAENMKQLEVIIETQLKSKTKRMQQSWNIDMQQQRQEMKEFFAEHQINDEGYDKQMTNQVLSQFFEKVLMERDENAFQQYKR